MTLNRSVKNVTWELTISFTAIVGLLFVTALFLAFSFRSNVAEGSTITGQDYVATSTAKSGFYGANTGSFLIKNGYGSFGSVTITGAAAGVVNFYDATTTDINKRTNNTSSSTILLASFPASASAQTYVFDVQFTTGLYLDLVSGNMPTSTVSYR